jgi:hypothetical protein
MSQEIWHISEDARPPFRVDDDQQRGAQGDSDTPLCGDVNGLALSALHLIDDADYRGILCPTCRAKWWVL